MTTLIVNLPAGLMSWRRVGDKALEAIKSAGKLDAIRPLNADGVNVLVVTMTVDTSTMGAWFGVEESCAAAARLLGVDRVAIYSQGTDKLYAFGPGSAGNMGYARGDFLLPSGNVLKETP